MPVLEERHTMPRSGLRYRPQADGLDPHVAQKPRLRADAYTTASTIVPDDLELEEEYHPAHRYRRASLVPRGASAPPVEPHEPVKG